MGNLTQESTTGIANGTVIDGRYKVVRYIGQGGNGLVHEVEHLRTGRRLALKSLLDEGGLGRLEQEARATSLLTSSHAAKITDMGDGGPNGSYLVMELFEGQSLRGLLDDAGQLPVELVASIGLQVCECLAEAHQHGIVHRDLKPDNVFLCPSAWPGQHDVKVLDFGVVKISPDGPIPNNSLTRTGSTVGTPYYMSLEQLRNSSAVDSRADVYALGVVLYESLSGRKPFLADTIGDLVYAICSGPPTHLGRLRPDLPNELADVVMRALSVDKDLRPKTMTDFAVALLPHGNPAFGLWIRVDGKQPALAAARVATTGGAPRPSTRSNVLAGAATSRALPAAPPSAAAKAPAAPEALGTTALWSGSSEAPVDDGKLDVPRRDTPTEMFVKDVHAPGDAGISGGDRDTPTRAIRTDFLEEQRRRPASPTLQSSAFGREPEDTKTSEVLVPQALSPDPAIMKTMPVGDMMNLAPGSQPLPQVNFFAPTPLPSGFLATAEPPKPGWQKKVDGALMWVGRQVEGTIESYRRGSSGTRALILVTIALVTLVFIGLFVFALLR